VTLVWFSVESQSRSYQTESSVVTLLAFGSSYIKIYVLSDSSRIFISPEPNYHYPTTVYDVMTNSRVGGLLNAHTNPTIIVSGTDFHFGFYCPFKLTIFRAMIDNGQRFERKYEAILGGCLDF